MKKIPYPSLYGQMAYVIFAGIVLIFAPNILLGIFGLPPANEIWIRIMGLLVLTLAIYYYYMANFANDKIVMSTVIGRVFFCSGLIMFVIFGLAELQLIGFAILELGLAFWTYKEVITK
jgi:hypothetical protein